MYAMIRVFMADDSEECRYSVCQCMAEEKDMTMVGTAGDGNDAVEKITKLQPDVVILDITLPSLDGIGVLKRITKTVPGASTIMLTAIGLESVMNEAMKYGAQYYTVKPFSIPELLERIRAIYSSRVQQLSERVLQSPREARIYRILRIIGFAPKLKGYRYLEQAIEMVMENNRCYMTKEIYPRIAKREDTTPMCVERGIRHAIEAVWEKGDREQLERYFGGSSLAGVRPTNAQFIMSVADAIKDECLINF